ncbi:hypothetical protein HYR53_01770 [Candidatus Acetothermia bacterium]|nr:hypothetical protein [Candidatus Acetothermia bacterium]
MKSNLGLVITASGLVLLVGFVVWGASTLSLSNLPFQATMMGSNAQGCNTPGVGSGMMGGMMQGMGSMQSMMSQGAMDSRHMSLTTQCQGMMQGSSSSTQK